jgi:hypothetical protein
LNSPPFLSSWRSSSNVSFFLWCYSFLLGVVLDESNAPPLLNLWWSSSNVGLLPSAVFSLGPFLMFLILVLVDQTSLSFCDPQLMLLSLESWSSYWLLNH